MFRVKWCLAPFLYKIKYLVVYYFIFLNITKNKLPNVRTIVINEFKNVQNEYLFILNLSSIEYLTERINTNNRTINIGIVNNSWKNPIRIMLDFIIYVFMHRNKKYPAIQKLR